VLCVNVKGLSSMMSNFYLLFSIQKETTKRKETVTASLWM
jgi:hypothetical protein